MNDKQFPLPDNPYVLVACIFGVVSAMVILVYLLQRASGRKLRRKLPAHGCPFCGRTFGENAKVEVKDIGLFNKLPNYDTPNYLWIATCPHCGKETKFTEHGQVYHGPRE